MINKLPCGRTATKPESSSRKSESSWRPKLEKFLESEGLRNSDQRVKIADAILKAGEHLTGPEIVARVKKVHPEIGPATIYRSLKTLCDAQVLKESLSDAQGLVVYEAFEESHHDHIVCLDCGHIFEFHSDEIEQIQAKVAKSLKFQDVSHRHVLYAKCKFKN